MYGIEGLLAGRTLVDRYHVLEVIGRGGMGAVYRARDTRLGRDVAVKVITVAAPDPDAHARLRGRFQREARAAAGLHHPNVVAVFDFGTDPALGLDFLVMELLQGEELATRLHRKGPPPVPTALRIVYQAALGLAAGHRAGLIHRDVKPGNLFLEPGDRPGDVRVKVLDFGIAEIAAGEDATVTHLTLPGRSPFSPAFASPEQMRGDPRLAPATDVFSLGAVAYQLLTGHRAFTTTDPRQLLVELQAALAALPERAPRLPSALRAAVRRALAPHPDDRFPDARAFAEALAPLIGDADARGAPETPTGRADAAPSSADEDEGTRLFSAEPARAAHPPTDAGTQYAPPSQRLAPELQQLLQRSAAAASARAPAPASVPPEDRPARPGLLRRTGLALWRFTLTALALALFAGSWVAVLDGLESGQLSVVYAGAVASVFFTPLAVHRVLRGRGSYRFALFGSVVGSIATVYFLGRSESIEAVLATLFVAQVVLSLGAERLTRQEEPSVAPDPSHTPGRA